MDGCADMLVNMVASQPAAVHESLTKYIMELLVKSFESNPAIGAVPDILRPGADVEELRRGHMDALREEFQKAMGGDEPDPTRH
jgi:hypothetical protein